MAIKLGFESQKPKTEKVVVVKTEARELIEVTFGVLNSDFYMVSLTQKLDKDTKEVVLPRHEIPMMVQDELKKNHIKYDLGMRVNGEELEVVIKSEVFKTVTDEAYASIAEDLANGEFIVKFTQFDEDGNANFIVDEDAPTEYWLGQATEWDIATLPVLRTHVGTVGKIKLCAYFTNEGLNFETFANREISNDGTASCTAKKIKGFSLQ